MRPRARRGPFGRGLTRPLHTEETRRERSGGAGIAGPDPTAPCYRLTKWRRRPARLARAAAPLAAGGVTLTAGEGRARPRGWERPRLSPSLLAEGGERGGATRRCAARLGGRRDAAGRSHLESGKDAEMPHRSAILIGGRAWENGGGSHLEYGQGRQRAHCVVIRGTARGRGGRHVGSGQGSRAPLPAAISSKGARAPRRNSGNNLALPVWDCSRTWTALESFT